jgi:O-antigen ligase
MYFKLSKFFLYVSVFSTTIVSQATIFPFVVGKFVWFRTSIDLALIFFLIGILRWQNNESQKYNENLKKVFKSPIGIVVSVFVGIFILAGIFGVDPYNSFWSNFERGEGGFQMGHFYILFLLLGTMFFEKNQWIKIFYCSIAASIITIGYGVLSGFGIDGFLGQKFSTEGFRFEGAIGNPAFLAAYLIFIIFYILYIVFTEYSSKFLSGKAVMKAYVPMILVVVAFFSAATRGAILGLIVGAIIFSIYLIFISNKYKKTFAALVIAGVLIFGIGVKFKDSLLIQKLPFSRIFDISFSTKTFQDRAIIWKMAWDGFKERPILGYGPENFLTVFNENFNPKYYDPFYFTNGEFLWFDRAHSIIFDYLAETGLLGFLSFFSIFGVYYWQFFSKMRKNADLEKLDAEKRGKEKLPITNYQSPITQALLFTLPIAYLVQSLVLFDTFVTYLNLAIFFSFVYYIFPITPNLRKATEKNGAKNKSYWVFQLIGIIGISASIFAMIYGSFLPYLKAKTYKADMAKEHTAYDFIDRFNDIYNIKSPIGNQEVSLYISHNIVNLISNQQNQSEQTMRSFVNFIDSKIFSNDVRQLLSMAKIYSTMWQYFHIEDDYKKSIDYYLKSSEKAPNIPPVLYGMFSLYYMHGDKVNVKNIGDDILKYWPQDTRIIKFLDKINI